MLCESPDYCWLCGLRIPHNIVASSTHPLYGTIDHVIPLSKGGKNHVSNRKPAHLVCNHMKGDKLAVDDAFIVNAQGIVKVQMIKLGERVTDKHIAEARRRVGIWKPTKSERHELSFSRSFDCIRWESEGGAVGQVFIDTC